MPMRVCRPHAYPRACVSIIASGLLTVDDRMMSSRFGGIPGGGIPGGGIPGGGFYGVRRPRVRSPGRAQSIPKSPTGPSEPSKLPEQETTGNRSDRGAGEHPDQNMGRRQTLDERLDRLRLQRRQRQASEISQSLLQVKEHEDLLRMAEVRGSKEKTEQYQKSALRSAGKSLDAARSALVMELLGRRSLIRQPHLAS
jgi:hypothetical protein